MITLIDFNIQHVLLPHKNTKVSEKRNDKENEVKISDVMMCFNCVDNNEFRMDQIVFHQMKHKLEGETRQNRGPKEILDLLPCNFCGKQSSLVFHATYPPLFWIYQKKKMQHTLTSKFKLEMI
eukprot:37109_1